MPKFVGRNPFTMPPGMQPNKKKPLIRRNGVEVKNATSRSTWKAFERTVADFFGSSRTPLSGINSRHDTHSDSLHPTIFIEAKYRDKHAVFELFKKTEVLAKQESKIPVVAIKQKGEKGYLLVLRPEDLEQLTQLRHEHISRHSTEG